jgi:hypothetical protein
MITISLTDEQAKWLQTHLDAELDDAHWGRGVLSGRSNRDGDDKEHAQTIHDKVKAQLKKGSWE